jgi:hypothetical protein
VNSDAERAEFCPERLQGSEIAEANLICAAGLPGSEELDIDFCLTTLDRWAAFVAKFTQALLPHFESSPHEYENSRAYFLVLAMITALQKHVGIRYDPDLIPKNGEFATWDGTDSRRVFLHGIIQGNGGTCATMPVLYAAVGRRLGYPIRIVPCKGHLFARWDDPGGERLNIEGTNRGLSVYPDEYYRTGRYASTQQQIDDYQWLKSLTAREESGHFLCSRALCCVDNRRWKEAGDAWARAWQLMPHHMLPRIGLKNVLEQWRTELRQLVPPRSPSLDVYFPPRRYPEIPEPIEQELITFEVMERHLTNPELERTIWGPLRRSQGEWPRDVPTGVVVRLYR